MRIQVLSGLATTLLVFVACGGGSSTCPDAGDAWESAAQDQPNAEATPEAGPDVVAPEIAEAAQDSGEDPRELLEEGPGEMVEPGPDTLEPDVAEPLDAWESRPDDAEADGGTGEPIECTEDHAACPGTMACLPEPGGARWTCVPGGTIEAGQACGPTVPGECSAGTVCVPWDEQHGACRPLCTPEHPELLSCPEPYQFCFPVDDGEGGTAFFGFCLGDACTPPDVGCEPGERCTVLGAVVFACVPAGTVPVGGSCEEEDCVPGAICKHKPGGGSVCLAFCQSSEECPALEEGCLFPFQGIDDWGWCDTWECDPVAQTGCGPGEACYYSDPEKGTTLCWEAGGLEVGADCSSFLEMCVPGADCFPDPGSGPNYTYHCYAYCDDAHPCTAGSCQKTDLIRGVRLCL